MTNVSLVLPSASVTTNIQAVEYKPSEPLYFWLIRIIIMFFQIFEFDFKDFPKISAWLDECKKNISSYRINKEGIISSMERRLKLQNAK